MQTLKHAIERAGGLSSAAKQLGVKPQRLGNWLERGVPTAMCSRVETALGVRRQNLRPDDWQQIWPELVSNNPDAAGRS